MDDRLPVEDDVGAVHGRPSVGSGADGPRVDDLTVVSDGHLVGGQVNGGDVAVTDDKGRGDRALAPLAPADVPAVEVARDLHLVADGPVGARAEVQLHGAEPVPATGDGLAHGDV